MILEPLHVSGQPFPRRRCLAFTFSFRRSARLYRRLSLYYRRIRQFFNSLYTFSIYITAGIFIMPCIRSLHSLCFLCVYLLFVSVYTTITQHPKISVEFAIFTLELLSTLIFRSFYASWPCILIKAARARILSYNYAAPSRISFFLSPTSVDGREKERGKKRWIRR